MFKRFGMAAAFVAASAPAFACSCPPLKTDAAKEEYKQTYANRSVKLTLKSFRLRITPKSDSIAEAVAVVLEQPKTGERYPLRILIESLGGDESANCGKASVLFAAASTQRWIRTLIAKTRNGRYAISACSPLDVEPRSTDPISPSQNN